MEMYGFVAHDVRKRIERFVIRKPVEGWMILTVHSQF